MARPLRIEFEGAWYHAMHRGTSKRDIYLNDSDRKRFLDLLNDLYQRWQVETHAYCLMGNHYHLMLHTPRGHLSRAMRHLNGVYTQYFNAVHNRDGSLFRGRYKAVLVQAEIYWTHLSRYIHRNPLDANMVEDLRDYPWSSYRYYFDGRLKTPVWLNQQAVLSEFASRKAYRSFVESIDRSSPLQAFGLKMDSALPNFPAILGEERFVEKMIRPVPDNDQVPVLKQLRPLPAPEQIIDAVSAKYKLKPEVIRKPSRGLGVIGDARPMAMYLCQVAGQHGLKTIADEFNLAGPGSAGGAIRNFRLQLDRNPSLRKVTQRLLNRLVS